MVASVFANAALPFNHTISAGTDIKQINCHVPSVKELMIYTICFHSTTKCAREKHCVGHDCVTRDTEKTHET